MRLLNIITINQRDSFTRQTLVQCDALPFSYIFLPFSPTSLALFFPFFLSFLLFFFQITLPLPPRNVSTTVELLFYPFSLFLFARLVTGARRFYLATPPASYFLSSRPTFGLIAIPTTPPPLLSPLPNQRPCCCVPLINSHNPFLTKKRYEFKEAKVGDASVSRYDSVFPFIDACIVRANFVKNLKMFLSL